MKIEKTIKFDGWEILTDDGWEDLSAIHKTIEYEAYEVVIDNRKIVCADEHMFFVVGKIPVPLKDLRVNDMVYTVDGLQPIRNIEKLNKKIPMYSPTVESTKEAYYADGVLHKNTTTAAIYSLHYILFNTDKKIAVLANKMQGAIEIVDRIKIMLEELPEFLKPGIVEYNKKKIVLENGCAIIAAATSPSAVRGLSINCIKDDDSLITLQDQDTGEIIQMTLNNVIQELTKEKQ